MAAPKAEKGQLSARHLKRIEGYLSKSTQYNESFDKRGLEYARKAEEFAIQIGSDEHLAMAYKQFAVYYCRTACDYKTSLKYCRKWMTLCKRIKEMTLLFEAYRITGVNYHFMGKLEMSFKHYLKALQILEAKREITITDKKEIARLYYNIGIAYKDSEDKQYRMDYLNKSLDIFREIGDVRGEASCLNSIGSYYAFIDETEQAITYQSEALELMRQSGDQYGEAACSNNLGVLYSKTGNNEKALEFLKAGLVIKEKLGNKYSLSVSYVHLGEAYLNLNECDKAIDYLLKALKISEELDTSLEQNHIFKFLSAAYEKKGDLSEALKYQKKYSRAREEVFNINMAKSMVDLQSKYEREKKEQEAKILRQKNKEIQQYAEQLESSNNDLKLFTHIASHDLKEPLRMISCYMGLLRRKLKDRIQEDENEFFDYATEGAQRLTDLITDLSSLTLISDSELHFDEISTTETISNSLINLKQRIQESNAEVLFGEMPTVKGNTSQLTQLFQNLIGNAIKYNTNETPQVSIEAWLEGEMWHFSIKDNGIGIAPEFHEKIFVVFQRLHNKDSFQGTGIGLAICKKIVMRHGGRIWVESDGKSGTDFRFTLPAAKEVPVEERKIA